MSFNQLYLKTRLSSGAVSLYFNREIQNLAGGLLGLFLPVFLFEKFGSLQNVLWIYFFSFLIYVLTAAWGAIIATKINFKRSLILSVPAGTLYFVCFYFFDFNPLLMIALALIFINLDRMFYWTPYHSNFALFTDKKNRGKIIAFFDSLSSLVSIFIPLTAGLILSHYGFGVLFVVVIVVYSISIFPLLVMPASSERYSFSYLTAWRVFFHPRQRRMVLAYLADGAQDVVGWVIWPIFIWQLLDGDYQTVGTIGSLVILVVVLFRLFVGGLTDRFDKKQVLKWGTVFYFLGWLAKLFVQTGWQIFAAASFHDLSSVARQTPYDALMYEKAADLGHYIDEYTVLREMALNLGRVLMILLMLLLLNFINVKFAFVLAAIASLFINLM